MGLSSGYNGTFLQHFANVAEVKVVANAISTLDSAAERLEL